MKGEKILLDKNTFAEKLGFTDWNELMDMSEIIYTQGNVSWFVTYQPMSGRYIAWDDVELSLDRVQKFDHRLAVEDFQTTGFAETLPRNERFMFMWDRLETVLRKDHDIGKCNHNGFCGLVPVLYDFLNSKHGTKTLELFREWYNGETPTELFQLVLGKEFKVKNWIDRDEVPAFRGIVEFAGEERAVIFPPMCTDCTYYGDEVPGCCSVRSEKPEPCDWADSCSQFAKKIRQPEPIPAEREVSS